MNSLKVEMRRSQEDATENVVKKVKRNNQSTFRRAMSNNNDQVVEKLELADVLEKITPASTNQFFSLASHLVLAALL